MVWYRIFLWALLHAYKIFILTRTTTKNSLWPFSKWQVPVYCVLAFCMCIFFVCERKKECERDWLSHQGYNILSLKLKEHFDKIITKQAIEYFRITYRSSCSNDLRSQHWDNWRQWSITSALRHRNRMCRYLSFRSTKNWNYVAESKCQRQAKFSLLLIYF